jgi:hypothetical protein
MPAIIHLRNNWCEQMMPQSDSHTGPVLQQQQQQQQVSEILEDLILLAAALQELDTTADAGLSQLSTPLSHYRILPPALMDAYNSLYQATQLIHTTSTKYGLLLGADAAAVAATAHCMATACHALVTATTTAFNPGLCARSTRRHCHRATRDILHTVIQLVQVDSSTSSSNFASTTSAAQRTGAVWDMCQVVLERKLPRGNRSAMRRDLLTYVMECADTIQEFQTMIVASGAAVETSHDTTTTSTNEEDGWQDFLAGTIDRYTSLELPVATACVDLIKCSRGGLNVALQVMDVMGEHETKTAARLHDGDQTTQNWQLGLSQLHDLATIVGEGMTDLGASMYPPLQMAVLQPHVERQAGAIQAVLDFVMDGSSGGTWEFPDELNDLLSKVRAALQKRQREANEAICACQNS